MTAALIALLLATPSHFPTKDGPGPAPFSSKAPAHRLLFGFHNASWARAKKMAKGVGTVVDKNSPGMYVVEFRKSNETAATNRLKRAGAKYVFPWSATTVDKGFLPSVEQALRFTNAEEELAGKKYEEERADYLWALRAYLEKRANAEGYMDHDNLVRAADHRDHMAPAVVGAAQVGPALANEKWQFLGPKDLKTPDEQLYYGRLSPVSGRVTCMVASGEGATTKLWVGTAGGGVWKSTDDGATFTCLTDKDPWRFSNVSSIFVQGRSSGPEYIYVGTGDYHGFHNSFTQGLMASFDGGSTWNNYGVAQFGDQCISSIGLDWNDVNGSSFTLATGNGSGNKYGGCLWHSTDFGQTWTKATYPTSSGPKTIPESSWQFSYAPYADFYAVAPASNGIDLALSSTGTNWGFFANPFTIQDDGVSVAASPTGDLQITPFEFYLLAAQHKAISLYAFGQAGPTYLDITGFPNGTSSEPIYNWSQPTYDYYAGVNWIKDASGNFWDDLFIGLITLAETQVHINTQTDALEQTPWVDQGRSFVYGNDVLHNDQQTMNNQFFPRVGLEPLASRNYFGNDAGLFEETRNPDGTNPSFKSLNENLPIEQFYAIAPHPSDPNRLIGGCQDIGCPAADGDLDHWENLVGADGGLCGWDVAHNLRYVTAIDGYVVQVDSSGNRKVVADGDHWDARRSGVFPFITSNTGIPIAATYRLEKYAGGAANVPWPTYGPGQSQDLTKLGGFVTALATAPLDDELLYTGSSDGDIWYTSDLGATQAGWHRIDTNKFASRINCISVDLDDPHDVLIGLGLNAAGAHVYHCKDTTAATPTWTSVDLGGSSGLPPLGVNALERSPIDPTNTWFAATDIGVFMTTNGGATWTNATRPMGLPNVIVTDLKYAAGYLNAATFGRGIWRLAFPSGAVLQSVKMNEAEVQSGNIAQGSVLVSPAPKFNIGVNITTTNLAAATPQGDAPVAAGASTGSFYIKALGVSANTLVTVKASYGGVTVSTTITVTPPGVKSVSSTPNPVIGGLKSTATVELTGPVGASGATVTLSSSSGDATVPSTATVAANGSSATFTINTLPVSTSTAVTIKATFGTSSQEETLTLVAAPLKDVYVPSPMIGGTSAKGAVDLSSAAPSSGLPVSLSSNSSALVVPASVTVPSGATTVSFNVTTLGVGAATDVIVKATSESIVRTTEVVVNPAILGSVTLTPTTTVVGGTSVTGHANLIGSAPPAGATVALSTSNTNVATVPASVALAAQAKTGAFTVSTKGVAAATQVFINASYRGISKSATLTVNPATLYSIAPNRLVIGGNPATETITLLGFAPPAGAVVSLTSNHTEAAAPASSVTIPWNSSSKTFTIPTKGVAATINALITATYGSLSKSCTIAVAPASLFSLTAPSTVVGGNTVTATLALNGQAPPAGAVVALHSDSSYAVVASSITLGAYGQVKTFSVLTHHPTSNQVATISAKYNGITKSAQITITP